jgi:Mn-dependent DtxR family transcriptional regulator
MIEFNINNYCFVQLTDAGRKELKKQYDELNKYLKGSLGDYKPVEEDANGWSKWQMHSVMNQLGHMLTNGGDIPFNTTIKIDV